MNILDVVPFANHYSKPGLIPMIKLMTIIKEKFKQYPEIFGSKRMDELEQCSRQHTTHQEVIQEQEIQPKQKPSLAVSLEDEVNGETCFSFNSETSAEDQTKANLDVELHKFYNWYCMVLELNDSLTNTEYKECRNALREVSIRMNWNQTKLSVCSIMIIRSKTEDHENKRITDKCKKQP